MRRWTVEQAQSWAGKQAWFFGKTQTIYPWGWNAQKGEPPVHFHDIVSPDGRFLHPSEEADIAAVLNN